MRTPQNYATTATPDGAIAEIDCATCFHCQRQIFVPVGKSAYDVGGGCRICNSLICSRCVDLGTCRPWEEHMLAVERKSESDRMTSLLVGR